MSAVTHDELVEILGDVDDTYIERIVDTGASVEQIGEALSDLEEELRLAEERRRTATSPQAAAVRAIFEELLDEDDEAVMPILRRPET